MSKRLKMAVVSIIGLAVILAAASSWNDSLIYDEVPHIGAGYSYLEKGDMRLNPEHPPLVKDLAALPLLFLKLNKQIFQSEFWAKGTNEQWKFGKLFIFGSGNNADLIRHAARLPLLIFFILTAILIFDWALRLYGQVGAILAVFLFAFSPTVLAHSRFVTTDIAAMFGILYATYFFIKYLKSPTRKNLVAAILIVGVALLTKFSAFLLVPYLIVLAALYGAMMSLPYWKNQLQEGLRSALAAIFVLAGSFIIVVWPVYYFHTYHYPPEKQKTDTAEILKTFSKRPLVNLAVWMADKPVIRAAGQYGLGVMTAGQRSAGGNRIFFKGQVVESGGPGYFPTVYFLKEPLAWWLLVLIGLLGIIIRNAEIKPKHFWKVNFDEMAMLLWLLTYWTVSMSSKLNIGVRHILPTYPFAILLVSGQISKTIYWLKKNHKHDIKNFLILIGVLLAWYLFEALHIFPYYLTYYNQVAGGPLGGKNYATDSNLDWGQDLIRLKNYLKDNKIAKIELDYFGQSDIGYYIGDRFIPGWSTKYKDTEDFKANNKSNGWIAVSATFLQQSIHNNPPEKPNYSWLQQRKPKAVIGNSIYVWQIK